MTVTIYKMQGLQWFLKFISGVDILLFFGVIIASAGTEKYICETKPIPIPFFSNDTSDFQPQITIWDYRLELLEQAKEHGPEAYHLVYISAWFIIVAYVVLEIWLYCVLIKALSQKRISLFYKWLTWRYIILAVVIAAYSYDIYRNQLTCTAAVVIPYSIFRIFLAFFIYSFMNKVKNSSSCETIIMTSNSINEKEKM